MNNQDMIYFKRSFMAFIIAITIIFSTVSIILETVYSKTYDVITATWDWKTGIIYCIIALSSELNIILLLLVARLLKILKK